MSISQILSSLGVPEGTGAGDGTVQTRISLHNETQLKDLPGLVGALTVRHRGRLPGPRQLASGHRSSAA